MNNLSCRCLSDTQFRGTYGAHSPRPDRGRNRLNKLSNNKDLQKAREAGDLQYHNIQLRL